MDGTVMGDGAGPRPMVPRVGNLLLAAARRLGPVRLERLPRSPLVPHRRAGADPRVRGDAVGAPVRDVLRWTYRDDVPRARPLRAEPDGPPARRPRAHRP